MNCVFVFPVEMDPSLLRERELFKKRALSTPAVEKRHAAESSSHKKKKSKADKEGSSSSKQGGGKHMSFLASFFFCFCFGTAYFLELFIHPDRICLALWLKRVNVWCGRLLCFSIL